MINVSLDSVVCGVLKAKSFVCYHGSPLTPFVMCNYGLAVGQLVVLSQV